MCNEKGGVKDDFVLSRQENDRFFMVYNSANRTKNYNWLVQHAANFKVKVEDVSDSIAMFAVQGPKAAETLQKITEEDLGKIQRFKCEMVRIEGLEAFISRTGYTGEDGFEVFILNTPLSHPEKAITAWKAILEAGKEFGIEPCGLGARNTLRLEAGMCLYGNDLNENITPLEARIGFVVKLQKESFIGKDALVRQKKNGTIERRVGLKMLDVGIPRANHEVFKEGERIGYITSGTFSPLLKYGIAMAYVKSEDAIRGGIVQIKLRNKNHAAEIVRFPFYDRNQYGATRKSA
jgi:aminomethyltransferase